MELTESKLDEIISARLVINKKITRLSCDREEVVACLYFRISKFIENVGYILHNNLNDICSRVFETFNVNIVWDKNLHPNNVPAQLEYILDCLYELEDLKIETALDKMNKEIKG